MKALSSYKTRSGLTIKRQSNSVDYETAVETFATQLDTHLGCLLSSSYEYPNRYKRWDLGVVDPMISLASRGCQVNISSLNKRGEIVLAIIADALRHAEFIDHISVTQTAIILTVIQSDKRFPEEERSKQPSVFNIVRTIRDLFFSDADQNFGLYGAFGYDLTFQFEKIRQKRERPQDQRDMVLFLPDAIFIRDHERKEASIIYYDFVTNTTDTSGLPHEGREQVYQPAQSVAKNSDHAPGEYANIVRTAQQAFAKGDLFEVVPGQSFFFPCTDSPSAVFNRLKRSNPSPYGFLMNLGEAEYLIGASPEMFVRVTGNTVETCPISGTIARGADALGDAEQIRTLLNSEKDLSELTMCTDVDRNDKSRICIPGSIEIIGRRQIELYSKLIHTVDHVTAQLRAGYDALDAFLSHTWAVTVTGAPKLWAMQFLEDHEKSVRRWYGGAVGRLTFDGNINTGLTLRTVRVHHGIAEVRVGATLLFDSIPEEEEAETLLKASALIQAITQRNPQQKHAVTASGNLRNGENRHVLLVDHQDSFVHTLADYFRQTGATVTTLRFGFSEKELRELAPDLIVLSPGPGTPTDFNLSNTVAMAINARLPVFGVCLGLQGITEHFGGKLNQLQIPQHGKSAEINVFDNTRGIFTGLDSKITVGRYHSLYADKNSLPESLQITAETRDNIIMAIQHRTLPIAAVQFHPESIMTLKNKTGLRLINNTYQLIDQNRC